MKDNSGKIGLIDTLGRWTVKPQYDVAYWQGYESVLDYWKVGVTDDFGKTTYGLLDENCNELFPVSYRNISLNDDNGTVFLTTEAGMAQVRIDGTVVNPFVVDYIKSIPVPYLGMDQQPDTESTYYSDKYAVYSVCGHEGLYDVKEARPITPAIYSDINAVSDRLFQCELPGTGKEVIIDGTGHIMK